MFRSNRHVVAQVIDDISGRTLAAASSLEASVRGAGATGNRTAAAAVGKLVAEQGQGGWSFQGGIRPRRVLVPRKSRSFGRCG